MKNKYVFLIVTPSFNQGRYIEETINSVIDQKAVYVYLVADGGSADETITILKKYESRLSWFSKKDNGQTDAINKGIDYFKKNVSLTPDKEYIFAYINSDDYYLPQTFSQVAEAFSRHPDKQWLVGEYSIDAHKNQLFHTFISSIWKRFLKTIYSRSLLLIVNPIAQPATFIRWEAVQQVGRFDERLRYVMDYDYWLRIQQAYGNPLFLNSVLASFRIHEISKGGSQFIKQFAEQYLVAKKYTNNSIVLGLHRLHNWLTVTLYSIMK